MLPILYFQKGQGVFFGQNLLPKIFQTSITKSSTSSKWKFIVIPMLSLVLLSGCQEGDELLPQDPANREMKHTIEFRVAQAKDYNDPVYDGVKASLNLTISVENMRDGSNIILWDTVFNERKLNEFSPTDAPLLLQKTISRVSNDYEVLRLSHSIRYFDKDNGTWMASKGETVPRDRSQISVEIGL